MEFQNGYFDSLLRSAPVRGLVDDAAERIAAKARASAPTESGNRTNEYKNGIVTAGKMQKRYVGLVLATNPRSLAIESRTGNLSRAVRGSGRGR